MLRSNFVKRTDVKLGLDDGNASAPVGMLHGSPVKISVPKPLAARTASISIDSDDDMDCPRCSVFVLCVLRNSDLQLETISSAWGSRERNDPPKCVHNIIYSSSTVVGQAPVMNCASSLESAAPSSSSQSAQREPDKASDLDRYSVCVCGLHARMLCVCCMCVLRLRQDYHMGWRIGQRMHMMNNQMYEHYHLQCANRQLRFELGICNVKLKFSTSTPWSRV
jgi:hypothetical protein